MDIDVGRYLGAVTREVSDQERDGKPARAVIMRRAYDTDVDDLWDALTNAERIPRWFLPITGDLRLGGRYQFQGNAGGKITQCEPPRLVAATWEFGGGMSWVTVTLDHEGEARTRLTLEHVAPVDDHWRKFGPGAVGVGWELGLMGLARHLETGATADHEEAEAWSLSDQGKAFARGSSDGWRDAAITAGEDREQATVAAERTRAFYSGETLPEG